MRPLLSKSKMKLDEVADLQSTFSSLRSCASVGFVLFSKFPVPRPFPSLATTRLLVPWTFRILFLPDSDPNISTFILSFYSDHVTAGSFFLLIGYTPKTYLLIVLLRFSLYLFILGILTF